MKKQTADRVCEGLRTLALSKPVIIEKKPVPTKKFLALTFAEKKEKPRRDRGGIRNSRLRAADHVLLPSFQ